MNIKRFKRVLFYLLLLFLVIYGARIIYAVVTYDGADRRSASYFYTGQYAGVTDAEEFGDVLRKSVNIATETYDVANAEAAELSQKYEKVADISAKSTDFDNDRAKLNQAAQDNKAVVQMENSSGLAGERRVEMTIGVHPDRFESMLEAVSKIGTLTSSSVTKTDKTYEYQQMLANQVILEKRKASFEELKALSGSIPERMQLQEKIIDVEAEIQNQMIGLGEYSDVNSFCTINFSLSENQVRDMQIGLILWSSLLWAAQVYAGILAAALFVSVVAAAITFAYGYGRKKLRERKSEK